MTIGSSLPKLARKTQALGTPWPDGRALWVFGYGSLIYRVDFPVEASVFGYIKGHHRAFLQESHDHRGTEESPGRVCTLVPHAEWLQLFPHHHHHQEDECSSAAGDQVHEQVCWGMAYKVQSGREAEVKRKLDYREKDGYTVDFVDVFADGASGDQPVLRDVMVYVGESHNPSFAGASSLEDTAKVIARAEGPSGTNRDYLFHLCAALRHHHPQALDPYLAQLETLVKAIVASSPL
ncbi:hypothetical protein LPJ53_003988 [Coemansia erecta]|uniref:glutathione-specific gamma-glutamylcyclotransferase n=1 Tax=Coemansia erecta TaxID=147472 RepID=A0A9W7XV80_9FUNG|nr:hypothetical protein LPJ53_003988 [Coemansia erecta]